MSKQKVERTMQPVLILAIGVSMMLAVGEGAMAAPKAARAAKAGTQAAEVAPAGPKPGDPVVGREKAESERCIE